MPETENLNQLAAEELAVLRREGVEVTDADVVLLNSLGWDVESPFARRELSRGTPVLLCESVYLWPLTIHASAWMESVGERLAPCKMDILRHPVLSRDVNLLALGYAMAHCYSDCGELDKDGVEASRAVIAWASKLKVTAEGLHDAIGQVIAKQRTAELPPVENAPPPQSHGEVSIYLAAKCGATPEYWERKCSSTYAAGLYGQIVAQDRADGGKENREVIQATRALYWAAEKIRLRHADRMNQAANG